MPYSHHSHSGQFCPGHATDNLEAIIQTAISRGLHVYGLSEHMPRHDVDRYPEEQSDINWAFQNEAAYVQEALRLRQKYQGKIELPLGFECDWIRPESLELIERSIKTYPFDYFIGSVHHVHTIPIDYDAQMYKDAKDKAGGTDENLFEDYFDAQLDMLKTVRPPIIGHFDLIRLKSANPNASLKNMSGVWQRVIRNLDFVASYGGILEINTAALRKGLTEPYPQQEICQVALEKRIRFCLSDDSHGIAQVASCYEQALIFLQRCGIETLYYLKHTKNISEAMDERFKTLQICETPVGQLPSLGAVKLCPVTR